MYLDHLGTTRATVDAAREEVSADDYDPCLHAEVNTVTFRPVFAEAKRPWLRAGRHAGVGMVLEGRSGNVGNADARFSSTQQGEELIAG